jgi:hypothetical protein
MFSFLSVQTLFIAIVGLDPAGPEFNLADHRARLDFTDAKFVIENTIIKRSGGVD